MTQKGVYTWISICVACLCVILPFLAPAASLIGSKLKLQTHISQPNQPKGCKQYHLGNKLLEMHNVDTALHVWMECLEVSDTYSEEAYLSAIHIADVLVLARQHQFKLLSDTVTMLAQIFPTMNSHVNAIDIIGVYKMAATMKPYGKEAYRYLSSIYRTELYDMPQCYTNAVRGRQMQVVLSQEYREDVQTIDKILDENICASAYYANEIQAGYEACMRIIDQQGDGVAEWIAHNAGIYKQLLDVEEYIIGSADPVTLIDAFVFDNQLEVLELRLQELYDVVDEFILVEATWDYSGAPKELFYEQNKDKFAAFSDKIKHIILEDQPEGADLEAHHYNAIRRGLGSYIDTDTFVVISNVDEIPDPDVLSFIKHKKSAQDPNAMPSTHRLYMDYYYGVDATYKMPVRWAKALITTMNALQQPFSDNGIIMDSIAALRSGGADTSVWPIVAGWKLKQAGTELDIVQEMINSGDILLSREILKGERDVSDLYRVELKREERYLPKTMRTR